jgi:hypothetical protein
VQRLLQENAFFCENYIKNVLFILISVKFQNYKADEITILKKAFK